jgi:hypothetical protein
LHESGMKVAGIDDDQTDFGHGATGLLSRGHLYHVQQTRPTAVTQMP